MDTARMIQATIVRVDIAIVAAWRVLRIALPVMVVAATSIAAFLRLRNGR